MTAKDIIKLTEDNVNDQIENLFLDIRAYYIKKVKSAGCKIFNAEHKNFSVHFNIDIEDFDKMEINQQNKIINKIMKKILGSFSHGSLTRAENGIGFFNIQASEKLSLKYRITYYLLEASVETSDFYGNDGNVWIKLSPFLGTRENQLQQRAFYKSDTVEATQVFCDEFKAMTDNLVRVLRLLSF